MHSTVKELRTGLGGTTGGCDPGSGVAVRGSASSEAEARIGFGGRAGGLRSPASMSLIFRSLGLAPHDPRGAGDGTCGGTV